MSDFVPQSSDILNQSLNTIQDFVPGEGSLLRFDSFLYCRCGHRFTFFPALFQPYQAHSSFQDDWHFSLVRCLALEVDDRLSAGYYTRQQFNAQLIPIA